MGPASEGRPLSDAKSPDKRGARAMGRRSERYVRHDHRTRKSVGELHDKGRVDRVAAYLCCVLCVCRESFSFFGEHDRVIERWNEGASRECAGFGEPFDGVAHQNGFSSSGSKLPKPPGSLVAPAKPLWCHCPSGLSCAALGRLCTSPSHNPLEHLDRLGVGCERRVLHSSNGLWLPGHRAVVLDVNLRTELVHRRSPMSARRPNLTTFLGITPGTRRAQIYTPHCV